MPPPRGPFPHARLNPLPEIVHDDMLPPASGPVSKVPPNTSLEIDKLRLLYFDRDLVLHTSQGITCYNDVSDIFSFHNADNGKMQWFLATNRNTPATVQQTLLGRRKRNQPKRTTVIYSRDYVMIGSPQPVLRHMSSGSHSGGSLQRGRSQPWSPKPPMVDAARILEEEDRVKRWVLECGLTWHKIDDIL